MKKILLLITLTVFLSCGEKDPCEDVIIDILQQTLLIELVDSLGNNLIENNTYVADNIYVERDGYKNLPSVYSDESFIPDAYRNLIFLTIYGTEKNENIWTVFLNNEETDTLKIDLKTEDVSCSVTFYEILNVSYNDINYDLIDLGNNTYKITVVK